MDSAELFIRILGTFLIVASVAAGVYYIYRISFVRNNQESTVPTKDEIFYCQKKSSVMSGYKATTGESNGYCEKVIITDISKENATYCLTSLDVCNLLLDGSSTLWPMPTANVTISKSLSSIDYKHVFFKVDIPGTSKKLATLVEGLKTYFVDIITDLGGKAKTIEDSRNLFITLKCTDSLVSLNENTDESYEIRLHTKDKQIHVSVSAVTYFGLRQGLETLTQLIVFDEISGTVVTVKEGFISDRPIYKYRGLMLNTGRSYYPLKSIKKTLDAMAMNKLNTFHWHITDWPSFPFASSSHPDMAVVGAFSSKQVYTISDIENIQNYATIRGIRIVPELEAPANVGEGWQHLKDSRTNENFLMCYDFEKTRDINETAHGGQLNPTIDGVYQQLEDLYRELTHLFQSHLLHIGGAADVNFDCWNTTQINHWIGAQDTVKNITQLYEYFYSRTINALEKITNDSRLIVWADVFAKFSGSLNNKKIIAQIRNLQTKQNSTSAVLGKGYDMIFSNDDIFNLDYTSASNSTNSNDHDKELQKAYYNDLFKAAKNATTSELAEDEIKKHILGAEAVLWSNHSDSTTVDMKLWPRCAILAENLWSHHFNDWQSVKYRLIFHRERMVSRGIAANFIQSPWCSQHPGRCIA